MIKTTYYPPVYINLKKRQLNCIGQLDMLQQCRICSTFQTEY